MPKKRLWPEVLLSFLPGKKETFSKQLMSRFGFLALIWLTGLIAYSVNGRAYTYLLDINLYVRNFGMLFLIFVGSYYVQNTLEKIINNFRPMLNLNPLEYQNFSERLEKYAFSLIPCIIIAVIFAILSGAVLELQNLLSQNLELYLAWNLLFDSFASLLVGTAIWMFASIWLTIFLISRQPLRVKLSEQTISRFRELSMFALWFGLFYFIGVTIGNISFLTNVHTLSLYELVISQYLVFVIVGIIGILFPFFNIHNTLLKMKKEELARISIESDKLLQTLEDSIEKKDNEQTLSVFASLFSIQLKEKKVKNAQEWPIDISFLSKLIAICLIPIMSRIIASMIIS